MNKAQSSIENKLGAGVQPVSHDAIARRLTGELVCIACGYNLNGLSIRENCPECGVPVRATLLGVVDPRAEEIEPLIAPKLVANGLVVWTLGALVAVCCVWTLRLEEMLYGMVGIELGLRWIGSAGFVALFCSSLSGVVLIRPHRSIQRRAAARAAFGVACSVPLTILYWLVYQGVDLSSPSPLLDPGQEQVGRSVMRIAIAICAAGTIWGLRANAVMLAMRSVIIRTGRVDRQSLLALIAAFMIAAAGDAMNIAGTLTGGTIGSLLSQLHVILVAIGSVLITIGLINATIDTLRLRPILKGRGVGLSDVFETNTQREQRHGSKASS